MNTSTKPALFTIDDLGGVKILRFAQGQLAGPDLNRIGELWSFLDHQNVKPSKVLVIEYPPDLLTPDKLDAFWAEVMNPEREPTDGTAGIDVAATLYLLREESALCRFIQAVREIDAFVICVLRGELDLPFLGPALACDYRIAADDTVFASRCLDLGIPPCGALPWFLTRFLGRGKTEKLLLGGAPLSVREAFDLDLVHEIVPVAELDARVLGRARDFAARSGAGLVAMKRSMLAAEQGLDDYLRTEARLFERCIEDQHFLHHVARY